MTWCVWEGGRAEGGGVDRLKQGALTCCTYPQTAHLLYISTNSYEYSQTAMSIHKQLYISTNSYEYSQTAIHIHKQLWVFTNSYTYPQTAMSIHKQLYISTNSYEYSQTAIHIHKQLCLGGGRVREGGRRKGGEGVDRLKQGTLTCCRSSLAALFWSGGGGREVDRLKLLHQQLCSRGVGRRWGGAGREQTRWSRELSPAVPIHKQLCSRGVGKGGGGKGADKVKQGTLTCRTYSQTALFTRGGEEAGGGKGVEKLKQGTLTCRTYSQTALFTGDGEERGGVGGGGWGGRR